MVSLSPSVAPSLPHPPLSPPCSSRLWLVVAPPISPTVPSGSFPFPVGDPLPPWVALNHQHTLWEYDLVSSKLKNQDVKRHVPPQLRQHHQSELSSRRSLLIKCKMGDGGAQPPIDSQSVSRSHKPCTHSTLKRPRRRTYRCGICHRHGHWRQWRFRQSTVGERSASSGLCIILFT